MSPENIDKIADKIIERLEGKGFQPCGLSEEQMHDIQGFLESKRKATRYGMIVVGSIFIWAVKDLYLFLKAHLAFMWR
jgi:hypothetical protein